MTIHISFRETDGMALLERRDETPDEAWDDICRVARDIDPEAGFGQTRLVLTWSSFLQIARAVSYVRARFNLTIAYDESARRRIETYVADARRVAMAREGIENQAAIASESELHEVLTARGWDFDKRRLTDEQSRDSIRTIANTHGANFSVPGAGKTTVALVTNLAGLPPGTHLLVVAPKNAFPAWDEVLSDCLSEPFEPFMRLEGGRANVRNLLARFPSRSIISYGQLIRVGDIISQFLVQRPVHVILDESHRIKAGRGSLTGEVALQVGPLAVRRDILSGTPMPNDIADLASQFEFLWPAQGLGAQIAASESAGPIVGNLYVRTTKSELGLPDPIVAFTTVEMSDAQRLLYGLLRDDALRALRTHNRRFLPPGVRTSVMRMLQAAIDPQSAVQAMVRNDQGLMGEDFRDISRLVMNESVSPRLAAVERHVRELAREGRKVVVWAPFRYSIERMTSLFEDLGAVAIHGAVQTGDESDADTREGILKRFHDDPSCLVLIANPAAGGEGISLHRVCHDAIYFGRTYNAAHYLQSRDRIHRLGLPEGTVTRIAIYEAAAPARLGSIDMSVRRRLEVKTDAMADALDDRDLRRLALESESADPTLDDGLSFDDLRDLLNELTGPDNGVD